MENPEPQIDALREQILADPALVLDDQEIIRALIGAGSSAGRNVVDLRGALVERLETRFEKLADTHRDVVAAAYENLAGTNQVHRAVLSVIAPLDFETFLEALVRDVPHILSLDAVKLCLEGDGMIAGQPLGPKGALRRVMVGLPLGGRRAYCSEVGDLDLGPVILRQATRAGALIYGGDAATIRSEAILKLDLGQGKTPAMLVLGSADAGRFHPHQATDLLGFFAQALQATLRRWLA